MSTSKSKNTYQTSQFGRTDTQPILPVIPKLKDPERSNTPQRSYLSEEKRRNLERELELV